MASANVVVHLKDCKNDQIRLIKRFIKKCKKEKVIEQVRDRRYYKKPSDKKREDRKKAERRRIRDELKKQRALEKRMRKNR